MRIAVLWTSGFLAKTILEASPFLAQAFLYADDVDIVCPASDELSELSDFGHFIELMGNHWRSTSADSLLHNFSIEESEDFARVAIVEAEGLLAKGASKQAFRMLRTAHIALHVNDDDLFPGTTELERIASSIPIIDDAPSNVGDFIALNRNKLSLTRNVFNSKNEHEYARASKAAAVYQFCRMSLEVGTYPLVDDARGLWSTNAAQLELMTGGARKRAANASTALGQIRRLPTIRSLSWDVVADVRLTLAGPLTKFRGRLELSPPRQNSIHSTAASTTSSKRPGWK